MKWHKQGRKLICLALSVMLVWWGVPAWALEGDETVPVPQEDVVEQPVSATQDDHNSSDVPVPDSSSSVPSDENVTIPAPSETDITASWSAGDATLDAPGTYVLSGDVEHAGTLRIAVGEGQALTLDLRGHRVSAEDISALVDASASEGDVAITDSTYRPSDDPEEFKEPSSALLLSFEKDEDAHPVVIKRVVGESQVRGSLTISNIRLDVSASSVEGASLIQTSSAVREGQEEPDDVPVTVRDCSMKATRTADADAAGDGQDVDFALFAVDAVAAGARGVTLDGFVKVESVKQEGARSDAKIAFASTFDRAYTLGSAFKPSGQPLAFTFPSKASGDLAVVARTAQGRVLDQGVRDKLTAESGDPVWNDGYTELSVANPALHDGSLTDDSDGLFTQSDDISAQAIDAGDLYANWAAQEGGFNQTYTIKRAGTYYLDRDLSANNALVIDAPGQDVVLKLNGHNLKLAGIGDVYVKTMLRISGASSVVIDGASSSGTSHISNVGEYEVRGISCEAAGCAVSMNDVTVSMKPKDRSQQALNVHAVYIESGSLQLTRATLNVDLSAQALTNSSAASVNEPTSAVYSPSYTDSVSLQDCAISCIGSPAYSASTSAELRGAGNVYCLYSRSGTTEVSGGSFSVEAASGNAACLYGKNMVVEGDSSITLKANAGGIAAGIAASDENAVHLRTHVAFSTDPDYLESCAASATLWGTTSAPFVFGSAGMPDGSQSYSVLIRNSATLDSSNSNGTNIAHFEGALLNEQRQRWADALTNALGDDAPCGISFESTRIYFSLARSRAVAKVGSNYFDNITSAIANFNASNGATLELLADVGDMRSVMTHDGVIEMNGHSATSLDYAASATATAGGGSDAGLTVKNGTIAGERNFGTETQPAYAAVRQRGACTLTLEAVDVRTSALAHDVSAVSASSDATGGIVLAAGTSLVASGSCINAMTTVYGINIESGSQSALEVSGASGNPVSVHVVAQSANVAAYGIQAPASAEVDWCDITVEGITQSVGGALVGGPSASTFENIRVAVSTSQAVTSACGLGGVSGSQAATVTVRDCSIDVTTSADTAGCDYWCLRSATNASLSSSISWVLGGTCSFASSGAGHVGYNANPVGLASDFALDSAGGHAGVLSIHQASCQNDQGFSSADSSDISGFASLFEPMEGSYYEGWELAAVPGDSTRLAWKLEGASADGAVLLKHAGAADRWFGRFSAAVKAAAAGDTVQLACAVSEPDAISVSQKDLTIDLNGYDLVMRVSGRAVGEDGTSAALEYTGDGMLSVTSPSAATLRIEVGSASEPAAGATYQGVCVSGGGSLSVDDNSTLCVAYAGATKSSQQREVSLYGVTALKGAVLLDGTVEVDASQSSGATGALRAVGIRAAAAEGASVRIEQGPSASVVVNNETASPVTDNSIYQTSWNYSYAQPTVREFFPEVGSALYDAIQAQFKVSASYDDPDSYSATTEFGTGIYYLSSPMTLSCPGEWYDNLKVWAYSDVVPDADVGKLDSIVATHFFMQAPYDTPTEAYGIESDAGSKGRVTVTAEGSTSCVALHGTAVALYALGGTGTAWTCKDATLTTQADSSLYSLRDEELDLRNYITFEKTFTDMVRYTTNHSMELYLAHYGVPLSCGMVVGDETSMSLDGTVSFNESGANALDVQAKHVSATGSFAPSAGTCSVEANGGNVEGNAFCSPSGDAVLAPSLFVDPAGSLVAERNADGALAWSADDSKVVEFRAGEAVVKRYAGASSIDLSEPSALTARPGNMMSTFAHTGWSTSPDEFGEPEYGPTDMLDAASLPASTVLYATYSVHASSGISVSFANVHGGASGELVSVPGLTAEYGQTLGEALDAASMAMPVPQNYVDAAGTTYCFVGWHDYAAATPTAWRQYSPQTAEDSIVFDYNLVGTSAGDVVLWATYVPVSPTQRLVVFEVDHLLSAYAAEIGARPVYTAAGTSNKSLSTPVKAVQATGVKYTFDNWADKSTGEKYDTVLPTITAAGDALVYIASYAEEPNDVTLKFAYLHKATSASQEYTRSVVSVKTKYDQSVQAEADKLAVIGSELGSGGIVYTMLGWAPRETDEEALYDGDYPIPSGSYADGTLVSDAYSRTYYAVYQSTAHTVRVAFYDGSERLGGATVESGKNINETLAAASIGALPDRSSTEQFLGWGVADGSGEYLNPQSTTIESLVGTTDKALSLYAVYGEAPTYRVMLYKEMGGDALYQFNVPRYKTIAAVAAENDVTVSAPYKMGSYFSGWYGASGRRYSLDDPVTGTLNLYAGYSPIQVSVDAGSPTSASVTYTSDGLEGASSVVFSLLATDGIDNMVRSYAASSGFGYSPIKSYSMRLTANYGDESKIVTGEFGAAAIQLYVGTNLAGSDVRVFWVGGEGRPSVSAAKTVDADGFITVSIGDYQIGDVTEGGNLMVGISTSNSRSSGSAAGGVSLGGSSSNSGGGTGNSLSTGGLGSALLSTSGLTLSSSGLGTDADGAASALANAAKSGKSGGDSDEVDMSDIEEGADGEGEAASPLEALFQNWDGNVALLIALIALAVALVARLVWWFIASRKVREEEEDDSSAELNVSPLLLEGIRF